MLKNANGHVRGRTMHPILALAGAVVIIDSVCETGITRMLRRNRGEALVGLAWLAVHILKDEKETS